MQWNLIKLRKEHGLNQNDMAELLGISVGAYRQKEVGESSFRDYEMFKLSEHFNKTMEEIFLPPNCINNAIKI